MPGDGGTGRSGAGNLPNPPPAGRGSFTAQGYRTAVRGEASYASGMPEQVI